MRRALRQVYIAGGLFFLDALCTALLGAQYLRVHGATIIVTNTNDSGPDSLRQALAIAHDGDVIGFDPLLNGQTISLTSGELVINENLIINGPGSSLLTVKRSPDAVRFRIFHVTPNHSVTIRGLTIGGDGIPPGGGIFNEQATLTIVDCIVAGNAEENFDQIGGGIWNTGNLTIVQSTISGNLARAGGGGISNDGMLTMIDTSVTGNRTYGSIDPPSGLGAGISSTGQMTIRNSTISGNRAAFTYAGGIYNTGSLTVSNSTVSNNYAASDGGGIFNGGSLTIANSTFFHNESDFGRGGSIANTNTLHIGNTILESSKGGTVFSTGLKFVSDGYNLSTDNAGGFLTGPGDQINTDPLLSPLGNNGGPTATHTLMHGSPAINAGDPNFTPPPLYDQRGPGYDRVFNGRLDIGSLEVQPGPTPTPSPTPGPATHFVVIANPDAVFPGQLIDFAVIAQDQFDNTAWTYTGTVHFTSTSDGQLPADSTLSNGIGVFNAQLFETGNQTITATDTQNPSITGTSNVIYVVPESGGSPTPSPTPYTPQLANISTRLRVETGEDVAISGFIIAGFNLAQLQIALRGMGPSLGQLGLPDFLPDPILELRTSTGVLFAQNDDWNDDPGTAMLLTYLGLAPGHPAESALVVGLSPGAYTATTSGKNGGTGVGLTEVYDVTQFAPYLPIQLANISTRGLVQPGDNVMIGGFILNGPDALVIASRGIGPSLTQFGVTNALADPTLELRDNNGLLLVANDNWQDDPVSAGQLIAHGLAPTDPHESGIYSVLQPGLYTSVLAGKNGGTGVGLVETYNLGMVPTPTPTPTASVSPTPTPPTTPTPMPCVITYLREGFDTVTPYALPAGWHSSCNQGPTPCAPVGPCSGDWGTISVSPYPGDPPNCAFHGAPDWFTDSFLDTFSFAGASGSMVQFQSSYDLESGRDGAVLEISIDGGPFIDFVAAGGSFISGGYTGTISTSFQSPISGRQAWTGNSEGWVETTGSLPSAAGQHNVVLRFRLATDCNNGGEGWRVDRVSVELAIPCSTPTPSPTSIR